LQKFSASKPSVFRRRQQFLKPIRLESHIVVEDRNPVSFGRFDSTIHGGGEPHILSQPQHFRTGAFREIRRVVRRTVVYHNDLVERASLYGQAVEKIQQQIAPVPRGNHSGDSGRGCGRHASPE